MLKIDFGKCIGAGCLHQVDLLNYSEKKVLTWTSSHLQWDIEKQLKKHGMVQDLSMTTLESICKHTLMELMTILKALVSLKADLQHIFCLQSLLH